MNKKGDEKILSVWMFLIFAIIAVAIVSGVTVFLGASSETRGVEAQILNNKIKNCLIDDGFLREDFDSSFDFFDKCNLYKENFDQRLFYFNVEVGELKFIEGDPDFKIQCRLRENAEAVNFAVCSFSETVVDNLNGDKLDLKILTGSNNQGGKL